MSVHFIGIGGAGMSGIAKVLLEMGHSVSGSDIKAGRYTRNLESLGAKVTIGHQEKNINNNDVVVISSAISERNVELRQAKKLGIRIMARAEMLAQIARQKNTVAVAGTHGKTTTTSMISFILEMNGNDPTYLIGGELNDIGSNARFGSGEYCVIEADESDGSLMHITPQMIVITNIDADHLDFYGSLAAVEKIFADWVEKLPKDGRAFVMGDNAGIKRLIGNNRGTFITYGLKPSNDYFVKNVFFQDFGSRYQVYSAQSGLIGEITLNVPGTHNILNSLAATAFCLEIGIDFKAIAQALSKFTGVKRRFQLIDKLNEIAVVDDYAHHPTEIKATLKAARQGRQGRVICIFQPHRYSRTKFLYREFGRAFGDADVTVMTDIYSAGEEPIPGVTSKLLVDSILEHNPKKTVVYLPHKMDVGNFLLANIHSGDLVLTMGAGDIWTVGTELVDHLAENGLNKI
ncbi:MAG TPA: UDP-N-acetylmuramate--L-alanine ligase [Actinobacteria bacterium]|nr:UDP-N-acetylmuramate--L-alanine ligase [Actinomycetes bacterium]HEX21204.1 UDP-N-acetylmuramate--L-alanine ligase [Actinomycetota bacterium]